MSQSGLMLEIEVQPTSPKILTPTCSCKCPSIYRYGSVILASIIGFAVGVTVGRITKK